MRSMFEAEGGGWSRESPRDASVSTSAAMALDVTDRDPVDHTKGDKRNRAIANKNEPWARRVQELNHQTGARYRGLFSGLEAEGLNLPGDIQTS